MIKIHRDNGESYETDSLTRDDAVRLAAEPGAWFDIEYPAATSLGRRDKQVSFPASSVVKVEPLPY